MTRSTNRRGPGDYVDAAAAASSTRRNAESSGNLCRIPRLDYREGGGAMFNPQRGGALARPQFYIGGA